MFIEKVRKRSLLKEFIDRGAKILPHPMEAARLAGGAQCGVKYVRMERVVVADNLERVTLTGIQDIF